MAPIGGNTIEKILLWTSTIDNDIQMMSHTNLRGKIKKNDLRKIKYQEKMWQFQKIVIPIRKCSLVGQHSTNGTTNNETLIRWYNKELEKKNNDWLRILISLRV